MVASWELTFTLNNVPITKVCFPFYIYFLSHTSLRYSKYSHIQTQTMTTTSTLIRDIQIRLPLLSSLSLLRLLLTKSFLLIHFDVTYIILLKDVLGRNLCDICYDLNQLEASILNNKVR